MYHSDSLVFLMYFKTFHNIIQTLYDFYVCFRLGENEINFVFKPPFKNNFYF